MKLKFAALMFCLTCLPFSSSKVYAVDQNVSLENVYKDNRFTLFMSFFDKDESLNPPSYFPKKELLSDSGIRDFDKVKKGSNALDREGMAYMLGTYINPNTQMRSLSAFTCRMLLACTDPSKLNEEQRNFFEQLTLDAAPCSGLMSLARYMNMK